MSFQDFEESTQGSVMSSENVWKVDCALESAIVYQGERSLRCQARAGQDNSANHGGTVGIYPSADLPVDLSSATVFSVWVYDTQGNNTIELKLCDSSRCSSAIWSEMQSSKNQWQQITWLLSNLTGIDRSQVYKIEIYEWHDGFYYWDNIQFQ